MTVALLWKELLYATFDPLGAAASGIKVDRLEYLFLALVALTIVVSLQAVGIILVVAMLVTPAATAQLLTVRFTRLMLLAALVGVVERRRSACTRPTGSTSRAAPRSSSSRRACSRSRWCSGRAGCWPGARAPRSEPTTRSRRRRVTARAGNHAGVTGGARAGRPPPDRSPPCRSPSSSPPATATSPPRSSSRTPAGRAASGGRRSSGRSTCSPRSGSWSAWTCPAGDHAYVACDPVHHHHAICTRLRTVARRRRRRPGRGPRRDRPPVRLPRHGPPARDLRPLRGLPGRRPPDRTDRDRQRPSATGSAQRSATCRPGCLARHGGGVAPGAVSACGARSRGRRDARRDRRRRHHHDSSPTWSRQVGGDRVTVESLVPKGGEVHTFDPTPVGRPARHRGAADRAQRAGPRRLADRTWSRTPGTTGTRRARSARTCRA